MVDITPTNKQAASDVSGAVTTQQPRSSVSAQDIAQPYADLSAALTKSGEALETLASEQAKEAGYKAVTTDADGNIQVQKMPIFGPASQEYARAVKVSALAQGEQDSKRQIIKMRENFRDDPESFLTAATTFQQEKVKQYTDAAGPEVGINLGKTIDAATTQTYQGLQNEHERLTLQRSDASITAGINSAKDDATALARGGDTSSPAFVQAVSKIETLTREKTNNPRLAYPKEAADYDLQQFYGHIAGQGFLYHIDQVYQDKGVAEDGSQRGGAANALEAAKGILTDPNIKLTEAQRQGYFSKATAEIRANEALRKQDVSEARAAASALTAQRAAGLPVGPEQVESVAQAFRAAGAPGEAARLYATYARAPLNDDFGKQPLAQQTEQLNSLRTGAGFATSSAEMNLIKHESSGNPALVNRLGYAGLYQFGAPLLKDLGVYTPGAGENLQSWSKTGKGEPGKWSGTFNVPGFPEVKTLQDFLASPAAQKATFDKHVEGMDAAIVGNGMDRFIGQKVGGVTITREGLHAMIHLGGVQGTMQTLASDGKVNARDENGTSLLDYARVGANSAVPNPASSMWLIANRATSVQKAAREQWATVYADYDKSGIRPADATINTIVNAARASNDASLLDGIAQGVDRMDLAQGQSRRPLPEQAANISALKTLGGEGGLAPGQAGVLKDLQRRNEAITTGLDKNPVSTTVQNFPDKFRTPAPLDLANPDNLAAGIKMRGQIAQFAAQNWQTKPVSALDEADLHQVQAALDTPNVAVKASIFSALSTLPEEVRNATLAKIGEKRPDFMVSAAAGSMLRQAPNVAQSVLRGQEAIKADKGYLPTVEADKKSLGDDLDKYLPSSAFSLAGRTTDNGPYEVARGMIKARYADISAQMGDTSGKYNSTRLATAIDDVTGGVLYHNGGSFIAPQRGMPQRQFDHMLNGVTDADLGNAQPPNSLGEATAAMNLTPQERALYQRHLDNLTGPGGVTNADGSRSTLFQVSFEQDGKTYNVPSVYDGKILPPREALARADKEGLDKFPSYASSAEAEARYQKMHGFMEKDTAQAMRPNPAAVTTLNGQPVTADYLRNNAQLESIGNGQYLVRLGKDPMRPVYAYQGANTETPQKFVLDLRNRGSVAAGPLTGYDAATAGNLGGFAP